MDRFELFSTPISVYPVEGTDALDAELTGRLVEESRTSPGLRRSNAGGWHSIPDLSQRREPCYQELMEMIVHHVERTFLELAAARDVAIELPYRYAVQGWAMVMNDGDYTIVHDHAQSHWSVAYYPDPGDADLETFEDSGRLTFVDPRRGLTAIPGAELFPTNFSVRPRAGILVVFPGWLQHYVHPYRGTRPRVSISCNLRMDVAMPPGR